MTVIEDKPANPNGAHRVRRALPDACALVCAVRDHDAEEVSRVLTAKRTDLYALAVVLAAMVPDDQPVTFSLPNVGVTDIAHQVAALTGTPVEDIFSDTRVRKATEARQIVCAVAAQQGITYSKIGRLIGRDHSTVMYAHSKVKASVRLSTIAQVVAAELADAEEVAG